MAPPLEKSGDEVVRCPMCGKQDIVPTRQRKWWDWFFGLAAKSPWVCRACECRFYVKKKRA